MLVGYMRVSSSDERQSVDLQRDALIAAGVDDRHLHQDKASGARDDRPGLKARDGSVCLHRLAVWISGSPLVAHAAARSGLSKYSWSGVRPPSAECGLTAL